MATTLYSLCLILLLSGDGLCQCFSQLDCGGDVLPSEDQRECCVLRNGLSYNDTGTCRQCIGILLIVCHAQQSQYCLLAVHGFSQGVYNIDEYTTLTTEFALNVLGTTEFPRLSISGVITAEASGTAGG